MRRHSANVCQELTDDGLMIPKLELDISIRVDNMIFFEQIRMERLTKLSILICITCMLFALTNFETCAVSFRLLFT